MMDPPAARGTALPHKTGEIRVILAHSGAERADALRVRQSGYRRYFGDMASAEDHHDADTKTTLLLAVHRTDGPVGTMRLMDSRLGMMEVEDYIPIRSLVPGPATSFAEATRLAVLPGAHSTLTKLLLWKAFMLVCRQRGIGHMVAWTKPAASGDYRRLLFRSLGDAGKFRHPRIGHIMHETFLTEVADVAERFAAAGHPLHDFMFLKIHREIEL